MKLKTMLSLLTSRELRKDVKSADERLRGRALPRLARELSAEAEQSAQIDMIWLSSVGIPMARRSSPKR